MFCFIILFFRCIICMCDLKLHDEVRYLPCLHTYHRTCIDDWLMRSFVCPSCLRPVEVDFIAANASTAPSGANDNDSHLPCVGHSETTTTDTEAIPASSSSPTFPDTKQQPPSEQGDAPLMSPHTVLNQAGLLSPGSNSVTDH